MGNPLNTISRTNDLLGNAISVIATKRERIIKSAINGALLFVILAVFGCLNFMTLQFQVEKLVDISYWGTVITKVVAGVSAYNLGMNIMWDTELKKDKILSNAIEYYNHLIKYKRMDFSFYVENVFNKKQKKHAYINHINRQIHLLNRFSRRKDKILYSAEITKGVDNYDEEVKKLQERKAKNKYCIKRAELEQLKSEDYINKNIDNINVKFTMIDASLFDLEIDGAEPSSKIKVKGNVGFGRIKTSFSVVLGMVGFAMFIASFRLELNKEEFVSQMEAFWHYFLKCTEDVGVILWQTTRGMLNSRKVISSELTQPYVGRIKVLEAYYRWSFRNDIISQKDLDLIVKLESPEDIEVELTQEQLDKIKGLK